MFEKLEDLFFIAVEVETRCELFYKKLRNRYQLQSPEYILFNKLAKDEIDHKNYFEKMLEKYKEIKMISLSTNEIGEIKGFIDEELVQLKRIEDQVLNEDNLLVVLNDIVKAEKHTVLFFTRLCDLVKAEHEDSLREIVNVENAHVDALVHLQDTINSRL